MKCHICDKTLSDTEIQLTPDGKEFEPCAVCLDIIMDTAYSDGFVREEPLDDPELDEQFGSGAVPLLEADAYRSALDPYSDLGFQSALHSD